MRWPNVTDCGPADDGLNIDIARIGWKVNVAVVAGPDISVETRDTFTALQTNNPFPQRPQRGGYLARLAESQ